MDVFRVSKRTLNVGVSKACSGGLQEERSFFTSLCEGYLEAPERSRERGSSLEGAAPWSRISVSRRTRLFEYSVGGGDP